MQDLPKEWLEFLRGQFPAGSRIQTWELDDPKNTLEEAGTLEHIDDEGRFHVRQSDGDHRILTLGEDTFSVHPPESQLKLYMPQISMPVTNGGTWTSPARNGMAEAFWTTRTAS